TSPVTATLAATPNAATVVTAERRRIGRFAIKFLSSTGNRNTLHGSAGRGHVKLATQPGCLLSWPRPHPPEPASRLAMIGSAELLGQGSGRNGVERVQQNILELPWTAARAPRIVGWPSATASAPSSVKRLLRRHRG